MILFHACELTSGESSEALGFGSLGLERTCSRKHDYCSSIVHFIKLIHFRHFLFLNKTVSMFVRLFVEKTFHFFIFQMKVDGVTS